MQIQKVGVVGAGLMGTGIVQVIAEAGIVVTWMDISQQQLHKGMVSIQSILKRKCEKGQLDEREADNVLKRIVASSDMQSMHDMDLIIEAVPENLDMKTNIFKQLDAIASEHAIIVSNTSGVSISALGAATKRPERIAGFHFFYPAGLMKLVEITPGLLTSHAVVEALCAFSNRIGKVSVKCNDYPGFVVNRILVPMMNEAIYLVMEGVKADDVDLAMKLGANHPMGPITLADYVGLDTLLATMLGLYEGFKDSKYRPCPLLVKKVEAGTLGRKTGKGFYTYDSKGGRVS